MGTPKGTLRWLDHRRDLGSVDAAAAEERASEPQADQRNGSGERDGMAANCAPHLEKRSNAESR